MADKRTQIVTAAHRLFREEGLGEVTMEEIARAAGMGKSSLYYYFKSQEEIFNAVLESEIGDLLLETIREINTQTNLLDKLTSFALVKLEMTRKRRSFFAAMEAGMDAEARTRYDALKASLHHRYLAQETILLQQIFVAASDKGEITKMNDARLEEVVFIFLSGLRGINREITFWKTMNASEQLLPAYCKIFVKGLH